MNKVCRTILIAVIISMTSSVAHGQVLISLLFGEALNTDKIEFGLAGGWNRSWIYDIEESKGLNSFNLGFYFHIRMKPNSFLSTGVLVKSSMGASGMSSYPIGDEEFDEVFANAELTKKVNYFQVPIMYQQRFNNRWYVEAGIQPSLRSKAKDIFEIEDLGGEISYTRKVNDEYKALDFGFIGGVGYKFKKQLKSLSAGVHYYYGIVDVSKVEGVKIKNSALYLFVKVPIGAGKVPAVTTEIPPVE